MPSPEVRHAVRDLLLQSPAYTKLPAATQQSLAHDMTRVADYLAKPGGIPGNQLPSVRTFAPNARPAGARALEDDDPSRSNYAADVKEVDKVGGSFRADAAREGAEVAGMILEKVKFVDFCSGLIEGVFHAIVKANIEQMEATAKLIASVAQSINDFRDQNVSDNQGRDNLVDKFPDLFQLGSSNDAFGGDIGGDFESPGSSGGNQPRVQLKDGVDEDQALSRVNSGLPMSDGPLKSLDLGDDENENKLVQASRTQLATSRQQLLATTILMGISRIVVTDGKLQAKIVYDFVARDNSKKQRSAVAADYARDRYGNVQRTYSGEGTWDAKYEGGETKGNEDSDDYERKDATYYTKGSYKYSQQPILTAMSSASQTSESALQTRATLSGVMDINFKSDYFPLEKMADSFQIGQIQNAAKPGRGAGAAAGGTAAAGTPQTTGTPAQPAAGATPAATQPAK
jgi:hypothetical protein